MSHKLTTPPVATAEEGRISFYASVHKEHCTHKEFHKTCIGATYRDLAESDSLLGKYANDVEDTLAWGLGIKKAEEPLLCFQFNVGHGAFVLHGDDMGDPYPNDNSFVAGGGGFGSTVANVTLRKEATVVFEVYSPLETLDAPPIAAVMFKVKPRGVWAMKGDSLTLGSHGVLPEYLCAKAPKTPHAKSRISVNLRYGFADMTAAQFFWMSTEGNEEFATKMEACVCEDSSACECDAEIPPPQPRTWGRPPKDLDEQATQMSR